MKLFCRAMALLLLSLLALSCEQEEVPGSYDMDSVTEQEVRSTETKEYTGALGTLTITVTTYKSGSTSLSYTLDGYTVSYEDGVYTAGSYTLTLSESTYTAVCIETYELDIGTMTVTVTLYADGSEETEAEIDGYTVEVLGDGVYEAVSDEDESVVYTISVDEEGSAGTSGKTSSLTISYTLYKVYIDDTNEITSEEAESGDYLSFTIALDDEESSAEGSESWTFSYDESFDAQTHSVTFTLLDSEGESYTLLDSEGSELTLPLSYTLSAGDEEEDTVALYFYPRQYLEISFSEDVEDLSIFTSLDGWDEDDFTLYTDSEGEWEENDSLSLESLTLSSGDALRIKLSGYLAFPEVDLSSAPLSSIAELPRLGDTATSGITSFTALQGNTYITTLPSDLFKNNSQITDMTGAFKGCTALKAIPSGLFDPLVRVKSFQAVFQDCVISYIPSGLFDCNTKATDFSYAFAGCSSLTTVPQGLFDCNTKVTDFSYAFSDCSKLTVIYDNFFDNNTKAQSFDYLFYRCYALAWVPSELFRYNTDARRFGYTFYNCSSESLTLDLYIGSEVVEYVRYFATGVSNTATVHVKSGTTYNSFSAESNYPNVTVELWEE